MGNNIRIERAANPGIVSLYPDSVLMRWRIFDADEPHYFDEMFDPWICATSSRYSASVIHVGGKDPTGLLSPDYISHARIDPVYDRATITAIPDAHENPDLVASGFPKTESGAFLQILIEINNNSNEDWYDVRVRPDLSSLGSTEPFLWYASYPRPLVPTAVNPATGEIITPGDDPSVFHAGWRFNPSALEVLNRIGDPDGSAMIPQIMASRRAYFIFHLKVDPLLPNGIYDIPFTIEGESIAYWETSGSPLDFTIAPAKFAVVTKNSSGSTVSNPRFVIGQADLTGFSTTLQTYTSIPDPSSGMRWFDSSRGWPLLATFNDFGNPVSGSVSGSVMSINLLCPHFLLII
jgi:hypothetical protein